MELIFFQDILLLDRLGNWLKLLSSYFSAWFARSVVCIFALLSMLSNDNNCFGWMLFWLFLYWLLQVGISTLVFMYLVDLLDLLHSENIAFHFGISFRNLNFFAFWREWDFSCCTNVTVLSLVQKVNAYFNQLALNEAFQRKILLFLFCSW